MAERERADARIHEQGVGRALKRRGILAAAGAAMAGLMARKAAEPVGATAGTGLDGNLVLGSNFINSPNTSSTVTILAAAANFSTTDVFQVNANENSGTGSTNAIGILGVGRRTAPGVFGGMSDGPGNLVPSGFPALNAAIYGYSNTAAAGVVGNSATGNGVQGQSTNSIGVFGASNGTGQVAGVYGVSNAAYGVIGSTTAPGFSGLTAITGTGGVAALAATSTIPSAFAAFFTGSTVVQGNLAVTGSKSAAVAHPDGSHRLLYCVEAPEAWFEDFGEGRLVGGKGEITLDAEFAALIETGSYHVFLTEHDATSQGLAVTARGRGGFTVTEHGGGTGNGTFSYRVVAKRKDNPGTRLEKFAMPRINHPDPADLPKPPPSPQPVRVPR